MSGDIEIMAKKEPHLALIEEKESIYKQKKVKMFGLRREILME